jgi:hypothetical protein
MLMNVCSVMIPVSRPLSSFSITTVGAGGGVLSSMLQTSSARELTTETIGSLLRQNPQIGRM